MLKEIEEYAKDNKVPIMLPDGILFLTNYIKKNNITNILEIGTAIGYSAIKMALVNDKVKVTTIEKDDERYLMAIKNIKDFNLENRITLISADALDIELDGKYDLIFIDAAKGQYTKFFEKYKYFLKPGGVIISDNLKFHGHVGNRDNIASRNLKQLVGKLENYIDFLKNNDEFETNFYDVGDGLSVSKRKNEE